MARQSEIEAKGLSEKIIKRFLETNNMTIVAKEFDVNYFNLAHYISWVKENKPEWLEKFSEEMKIDVFRIIRKYVNKLDKKLEEWDTIGNERLWLSGLDRLNKQLEMHVNSLEKVYNMSHRDQEKEVIIKAISEESPELALKIISRLRALKEERGLLGS